MISGWVFSTAIVVGLQLYVRVGASYHVCCILSTIISSIYRLCITHKQLQSLLTFLYMHSLDWCLLQEVWIRLIMAKGQRHTMHKNINMWCIVRWMKIRCMLFRCWCTISIVRIIGKISWYWCFIWYRCTLTLFGLNYTLLFLVSIGMLIGMVWYIASLVHLSRWRKIYWDTQQLTLPRLHIWNSGYYAVKANTEGTDLPRDMVSITCTECLMI